MVMNMYYTDFVLTTARKRSFRERQCFYTCVSFCSGGGSASGGVCIQGGLHPEGVCMGGGASYYGIWSTGMHSCVIE